LRPIWVHNERPVKKKKEKEKKKKKPRVNNTKVAGSSHPTW
jgi:hypothetical protein